MQLGLVDVRRHKHCTEVHEPVARESDDEEALLVRGVVFRGANAVR